MSNSTFLRVLLGAILLGVSFGAVFYGGVALGRTQVEPAPAAASASEDAAQEFVPQTVTFTPEDVAEMRKEMEARFGGELPEGMQAMLDQFAEGGTINLEGMRRRFDGGTGEGIFGGGGEGMFGGGSGGGREGMYDHSFPSTD